MREYYTSNLSLILALALILIFNLPSHDLFGQIKFQKAYFITADGKRTDCLIKDEGWEYNPTRFEYKLTEQGKIEIGTLESIKEFGIDSLVRFIKSEVLIDRSSDNIDNIINDPAPQWKQQTVFLAFLIEGPANLFRFRDPDVSRFFFSLGDGQITQLVYKRYYAKSNQIAVNDLYRSQLKTALICEAEEKSKRLAYTEASLREFVSEYNECITGVEREYQPENRVEIHFRILTGVNLSELNASYPTFFGPNEGNFGPKPTLTVALDLEFVIPFRKNKWSVFLAPGYRRLNDEYYKGTLNYSVNYTSFELPLGLRYYAFLSEDNRFFVNAAYVFDFAFNSEVKLDPQIFEIRSGPNYMAGAGWLYKRYSAELRVYSLRDVLLDYAITNDYKNFSFLIGYRF